jgi:YD repeat-containing protein
MHHDKGTAEHHYDEKHRLVRVETRERTLVYEYDKNGNRISKSDGREKTVYAYDCQNRLLKIIYPDKSVNNYMYCPLQRRISKDDSRGVTMYFHDGSIHDGSRANIILEYDMDLSVKARYTCGLEIGEIISRSRDEETVFYHYDGMGNISELTDRDQNVAARYRYDDFGNREVRAGTADTQYGFAGHEYDGDPAFYYVGDYTPKYYDPAIGTYIGIGAFNLL